MVATIHKGNTVIDYFNVLMLYYDAENNPINALSCNRFEWVQFLNLVKMNYEGCQNSVETIDPTTTKYKDIVIYYDGTDNDSEDYRHMMYDLVNRLEERRRLNTTPPNQTPETTDGLYRNVVTTGYIEPTRTGRVRTAPNLTIPQPVRAEQQWVLQATRGNAANF